jgi:uncharacterized protein (DUF2147 family)
VKFLNKGIFKKNIEALNSQGFFYFYRMRLITIVLIVLTGQICYGQTDIVGKWKTIDDDSEKEKSIVEITERNGKIYGKIIKLFREPGEDPDPICDQCDLDDARYKKKVMGMEIIKDLIKSDDVYEDGTILDPKNGEVYRCKIWRDGNDLMVRGYIGPFFRTQPWKKVAY